MCGGCFLWMGQYFFSFFFVFNLVWPITSPTNRLLTHILWAQIFLPQTPLIFFYGCQIYRGSWFFMSPLLLSFLLCSTATELFLIVFEDYHIFMKNIRIFIICLNWDYYWLNWFMSYEVLGVGSSFYYNIYFMQYLFAWTGEYY